MPLIKTLARDMKPGDIITMRGIYLKGVGVLYEVERPDPDEALVEVMAQAIRADENASEDGSSGSWDETTDSIRADYRSNARAALAAARKAGLL